MSKKLRLAALSLALITTPAGARTHHHHHGHISNQPVGNQNNTLNSSDNGLSNTASASTDTSSNVTLAISVLVIVGVGGAIIFFTSKSQARDAEIARRRANLLAAGQQASLDYLDNQKPEYPYISRFDSGKFMLMDGAGSKLRFLIIETAQGLADIREDAAIMIADIVSLELVKHERVITESTTVTKKSGTLGRAVVGELVAGSTGAIVGAVSAGSKSKTVAIQRAVYEYSELVFGMADLAKPVFRFESIDHAELDQWLHRIRSAIQSQSMLQNRSNLELPKGGEAALPAN